VDTDASVSSIQFADKDLDGGEIGGHVTWTPPADASLVSHYLMYIAAAGELITRFRIGIDIPVGTNVILLPPETAEGPYERVVVYTKSTLAEQTTPVAITLVDNEATVQTIVYPDEDLDAVEIAGPVIWQPPVDVTHVTHYSVYVGAYSSAFRTTVGGDNVPVGTNQYFIANNFAISLTWTDEMPLVRRDSRPGVFPSVQGPTARACSHDISKTRVGREES